MKQGITLGIHPALLPRQPSDCNDEQFIFCLQHCQQMRGATGEVGCSPHPSWNQIRASEEGDMRDCRHLPSYPERWNSCTPEAGQILPVCIVDACCPDAPHEEDVPNRCQLSTTSSHHSLWTGCESPHTVESRWSQNRRNHTKSSLRIQTRGHPYTHKKTPTSTEWQHPIYL